MIVRGLTLIGGGRGDWGLGVETQEGLRCRTRRARELGHGDSERVGSVFFARESSKLLIVIHAVTASTLSEPRPYAVKHTIWSLDRGPTL